MPSYDKNNPKIKQLVAKLQAWDERYHNTGKPAVSDAVYNKWKLILEKYVPDHPYLERVGAPVKGKSLRLPFFMPSLGKVYPERNADKFLAGVSGSLLALAGSRSSTSKPHSARLCLAGARGSRFGAGPDMLATNGKSSPTTNGTERKGSYHLTPWTSASRRISGSRSQQTQGHCLHLNG